MLIFGVAAALLCALLGVVVVMRAAAAERLGEGDDPGLAMHRRQLAEIDELEERGLMPESEVKAAKAEAGRRLLASARRPVEAVARSGRGVVIGAAFGAPILALALYLAIGSPGTPDQPFLKRAREWQANPTGRTPAELAAAIAAMAPEKKNEPAFYRNLGLARLMAGQTAQSEITLLQGIKLAPQDASLWALLGRARLSENGAVPPAARAAFEQALALDPTEQYSRYYLGQADIEAGQVQQGLARWRDMLASLPAGDVAETLRGQIDVVQKTGRLPGDQAASSGQDVAAAAASAGVDVNAMVAKQAAQLKDQPNDPAGWQRLIRAYSVLGQNAKRDEALGEARRIFAGRKDVLQAIEQAAAPPQ